MGPDYVRMSGRFECTNGCHDVTEENLESRRMSYITAIGATPEAEYLVIKHKLPLKLIKWYD